eukprot:9395386-Alexandrium_andersonii.AAC.1
MGCFVHLCPNPPTPPFDPPYPHRASWPNCVTGKCLWVAMACVATLRVQYAVVARVECAAWCLMGGRNAGSAR